jgi:hypothetical protein
MANVYLLNYKSEGFSKLKSWTITVDGEVIEWRPEAPYLFALTPGAAEPINEMLEIFKSLGGSQYELSTFMATPTGPEMTLHLSNLHTVLYLANYVFDIAGSFDPDDFEDDEEPRLATLSKSAPKLETIFGPQDDGILY